MYSRLNEIRRFSEAFYVINLLHSGGFIVQDYEIENAPKAPNVTEVFLHRHSQRYFSDRRYNESLWGKVEEAKRPNGSKVKLSDPVVCRDQPDGGDLSSCTSASPQMNPQPPDTILVH